MRYALTLEDADGNPAAATPEIVAAMDENLAQRGIEGSIRQDANGVHLMTDANLDALVNEGKLMKVAEGEPAYSANKNTYVLEEIGEDPDGGIYNAVFSVPKGGRRRGKKTRKLRKLRKGKSKKTQKVPIRFSY